MRLINTETLLLKEFYTDIPPYAILSHRWEEEEVAFADYPAQLAVLAVGGTLKKGFGKIELCAKQARLDGLAYCWVDTCCIDKSSSAELTEAINSMYAWYRDSAVCYIYMSDVDVFRKALARSKGKRPMTTEELLIQRYGDDVMHQLTSSQWFSRGWTLQELLAPSTCIFYDVEWVPLVKFVKHTAKTESNRYGVGPKPRWSLDGRVEDAIRKATGLDVELILDFTPTSRAFSVATKMSWASKRKTTRAEDMAYCLMGIFDVNMPLLYGEGAVKAFRRLQEEIIKQTDDHSIFYWRDAGADRSAFRGLLARSTADFSESGIRRFPVAPAYTRENRDTQPSSTHDKTFGMTNRGLRITLATVSSGPVWEARVTRGDDEVLAILECGTWTQQKYCIILARVSDDGDYARVDAHKLPRTIFLTTLSPSQAPVRDIFVRQEPVVHEGYISSRMTAVEIVSDEHFEIVSTCPQEAWDAKARQIRPMDPHIPFGTPCGFEVPSPSTPHDPSTPDLVDCWFNTGYMDGKKPLATAVVRVLGLLPREVPSTDFTISLRWKSRREGDDGPYEMNVQFDQAHYTGETDIATHRGYQQQTGWKVSPKCIVWTSSSWILRIGVLGHTRLAEGRLVLTTWFTFERTSAISGRSDPPGDFWPSLENFENHDAPPS